MRVSEPETLSLQKSAKNRGKNPNSLRSDMRIFAPRACLKIHSRHLHAPLCGIFGPNSLNVAHYAAFIWAKSPTNCDAQLPGSNFQTRSRVCLKIHSRHLYTPLCGIFGPNSGYIAHYAPFIWPKSPTNCDAHLPESNFQTRSKACLKIHSRHLHAPLRGIFGPNSLNVAHYAAFIWAKSPTKWSAQLPESNFQTHSRASHKAQGTNARKQFSLQFTGRGKLDKNRRQARL